MQDRDLALAFLPGKGLSNRRRCCCCSCRVLCSLRHVINHPVCVFVCMWVRGVYVCLCVRACTTFPRTSKCFRGKWRHKFKFGVSFVRFCYCNGHSPLSQRCVAVVVCDKTNQFKAATETAAELKSLISGALKQQQQQLLQRKQLQLQQEQEHEQEQRQQVHY